MPTKTLEKNKLYVAKHRTNLRASIGDEAYKKQEAQARQLRRLKAKANANSSTTTAKLVATQTASSMVDDLFSNILSNIPQTRRGRPKKDIPPITTDLSYAQKRRIYMQNYMRSYRKNKNR